MFNAATQVKTWPAWDSKPGEAPKPPSKLAQLAMYWAAAVMSMASSRSINQREARAQYVNRVSISPHSSPTKEPSAC